MEEVLLVDTSEFSEFIIKPSLSNLAVEIGVTGYIALFLPGIAPLHYVIFFNGFSFLIGQKNKRKNFEWKEGLFFMVPLLLK